MRLILAALAAAALLPVAARAAPTGEAAAPPAPPVVAAPDPARQHKLDLARRYFEALKFDHLMHQMMQSLMGSLIEGELKSDDSLPPNFRGALTEAAVDTMDSYMPLITQRAIEATADTFTEDELQKLVDFYESDVGRSIMSKSDALAQRMQSNVSLVTPDIRGRMIARLCRKIDCSALPKPLKPNSL